MAANTYEILYLLDPNKFSADQDGVVKQMDELLQHHGAEIVYSRPWGEPKLAYTIKNFKKGAYLLSYFKIESTRIPAVEHDIRLNETVLRHLIIKLHPKIAEQVVAHVTTQGAHHEPPREPMEAGGPGGRRGGGDRRW